MNNIFIKKIFSFSGIFSYVPPEILDLIAIWIVIRFIYITVISNSSHGKKKDKNQLLQLCMARTA